MNEFIGRVINGNCIEVMDSMEEGSVDLIVTSPPYGVGIDYDVHDDDMV
jgi:DNA modification methylase